MKPINISRISLLYSSVEDRIRLAGETGEEDVLAFWLTQRLCRLMVKAMAQYVERTTSIQPGLDRSVVLAFQQNAAVIRNDASEPVRPPAEANPVLMKHVDLKFGQHTMSLLFSMPDGRQAQLTLGVQQVRQFLGIMHRQYCLADWPLDAWPDWMNESVTFGGASSHQPIMH